MNLRPDLRSSLLTAWAVFAGALLICGLVIWWMSDSGDLPQRLEAAEKERNQLQGNIDLVKRIDEQKQANNTLAQTIEVLKASSRFTPESPFKVPANHPQAGQYFNEQLAAVQDYCRPKARERSIAYQENLGFVKTAKVHKDEDAPYLLAMLQMTRKAADVILSTPSPVQSFKITQLQKQATITGPAGRPPLLREYVLTLNVRGSLSDLLWILHRLAQKEEENDYPLIVRGIRIESKNLDPKDSIQQLDAVFEVAAMEFLSEEERAAAAKAHAGRSGNGRSL
jgi:hypothetical protein